MPRFEIISKVSEIITESTISEIVKRACNSSEPISSFVKVLPPANAVYFSHVIAFIGPANIVTTNVRVFKKCMVATGGSLIASCFATGVVCLLVFIPGPQQGPSAVFCQGLLIMTDSTAVLIIPVLLPALSASLVNVESAINSVTLSITAKPGKIIR